MATKLYPPYIEGKLPAQYGDTLSIPFQLNRAQGEAALKDTDVLARIETVSTNQPVFENYLEESFSEVKMKDNIYYASFDVAKDTLVVGQFYRIQLAFKSADGAIGYFSTVGVFKYTGTPQLTLTPIGAGWVADFSIKKDPNEKITYYKFDVYSGDECIETTDWQIHSSADTVNEFEPRIQLDNYDIVYSIQTSGGIEASIREKGYGPIELPSVYDFFNWGYVTADSEEGVIKVGFKPDREFTIKGKFKVYRSHDNKYWELMHLVTLNEICLKNKDYFLFEDCTVEQGRTYTYAIQQFDSKQITEKVVLGSATINFEDCFLFDGERQLKIKFNPKISSFKTTLMESKIDTIGSKYPFFFKNGLTAYKEFPISGLISFQMDENNRFMESYKIEKEIRHHTSAADNGLIQQKLTDLVNENILRERDFKLAVLDWLNNGKPKVFRSPTEGNYFVRLMNISLTPEDRLGRMLHTFNCTAYEVADFSIKTLQDHNIIAREEKITDCLNHKLLIVPQGGQVTKSIYNALIVRVLEAGEGSVVRFIFANGAKHSVQIGRTGYYNCYIDPSNPVVRIEEAEAVNTDMIIEYLYKEEKEYWIDPALSNMENIKYEYKVDRWADSLPDVDKISKYMKVIYLRLEKKDIERYDGNIVQYYSSTEPTTIKAPRDWEPDENDFTYILNGEKFNLLSSGRIILTNKDVDIKELKIGAGIYADVYYRILTGINSTAEVEDGNVVFKDIVEANYEIGNVLDITNTRVEYNADLQQLTIY